MSRTYDALKKAEAERSRAGQAGPRVDGRRAPAVPWDASGESHMQYERIRVWVTNPTARASRLKTLMVVACHPESGTTTTATLLAASLAEGKRSRVLLVDANFRTPSLDLLFGVRNKAGLAEALASDGDSAEGIQPTNRENLFVLPTGRIASCPVDVLDREAIARFTEDLKAKFDFVVFDAAPALDFPDACALAPYMDGTLLVVEADKTSVADAKKAKRELERAGARLFGVVLNRHREYMPRMFRGLFGRAN